MRIALYCSASSSLDRKWRDAAVVLGRWIAANRLSLVYGGVDAGLMAIAAKAAAGTEIIGVVPSARADMASPKNTVVIPSDNLNDRKAIMQDAADIFVVFPGGYGTLDEMMSAFAYINFNNIAGKSIVLYNPDGFYDGLLAQLRAMADTGLMCPDKLDALKIVESSQELILVLEQKLKEYEK